MPRPKRVRVCLCPRCAAGEDHPDRQRHAHINLPMASLNDQQRRVFAAIEADRLGRGGARLVSLITGVSAQTIGAARRQLANQPPLTPLTPDPRFGGRPWSETKYPGIRSALDEILADAAAGGPMSEEVWVRSSVEYVASRLGGYGIEVSGRTVNRLLRRMGCSMKYSKKRRAGAGGDRPEVEEQFGYIAAQRKEYLAGGLPVTNDCFILIIINIKELHSLFLVWRLRPLERATR